MDEKKYVSLADISTKSSCVVISVHGHGGFRHRVMELGFVKGVEVTVVKNAPLLDPIEYEVMNTHVSLRRSEAERIEVVELQDSTKDEVNYNGLIIEDIEKKIKEKTKTISVALVGNPNSGKTSFFNHATGLREKVGNYSGVTVESKVGTFYWNGYTINMIDLPGTYSTTEFTQEEVFVREYISKDLPDVVLNIVNASNLERSMFLTTQLIDMNVRMVMALNMYDELEKSGASVDYVNLGNMLGFPIVPTVSTKGKGIDNVLKCIVDVYEDKKGISKHIHINFGNDIEEALTDIKSKLAINQDEVNIFPLRFVALKILENDSITKTEIEKFDNSNEILKVATDYREKIEKSYKEDIDSIITNARFGFIRGALKETFKSGVNPKKRLAYSLDVVLTNKWLGFPVLFLFLWIMFQTTFTLGAYPQAWIESGINWLGDLVSRNLRTGIINDLIVNGIIQGVGGVLVFLPNILILFWFISVLEDSGYMSRAAFIMDKLMHRIGLHGKSFIPFLIGFGCSVPAIMATRTLENKKDRIITMLAIPFMSCSARLPVYILFVSAFFAKHKGLVMLSLYLIGIMFGILTALILKKTVFKNVSDEFVIELPPYRVPTLKNSLIHMWDKSVQYIKKIGSVILLASIIIWALQYFPQENKQTKILAMQIEMVEDSLDDTFDNKEEILSKLELEKLSAQREHSYIGQIGHFIEPAVRPLGFDWRMGVSILTGFAAKEIIVSSLGILYQAESEADESSEKLITTLQNVEYTSGPKVGEKVFSPLVAYAFMLFVLLYFPCFATLVTIRKEAGLKWAAFSMVYTTLIAWIVSFTVYQIGILF
ncbi:ferrous iron transport protein B [Bacteroidales bacterium OttesenSCG-928-K03]|nr:ferrous iron transport protein B [Bacteroidales bacterium OttesenSCG-928-L14]MDL2242346.1 ferrous iron transport protein B [Bacteroidales bacterium OttesenSCG-928-K03]